MKLHIHWFKRTRQIGPYVGNRYGVQAWCRFVCRCGAVEERFVPVQVETRRRVK